MKKVVLAIITALVLALFSQTAFAANSEVVTSTYIQQIDETSYYIVTVSESPVMTRGSVYTKSGSKSYTYTSGGTVTGRSTVYPSVSVSCNASGTIY